MGREKGITEEKLHALDDYENSSVINAEEAAVLRYADAMTDTPVKVSDDVFEALRALYDDGQLIELTSALAWENYRARFDHALGVESEGFSEGAFCPLPVGKKTAGSQGA